MKPDDKAVAYYQSRQTTAQSYNLDMTKWILASLLAVNGAPFVLLSKDGYAAIEPLAGSLASFAIGLALAVVCGFSAWFNTGMREIEAGRAVRRQFGTSGDNGDERAARPEALSDRALGRIIVGSYVFAVITGFASLGLFVAGALQLTSRDTCPPARPAVSRGVT